MQARVARYVVPPERCDEAVEAFLDSAREIADMNGFGQGYIFVDSETGTAVSLTMWADNAAFESSATKAALARRRAVDAVDGEVQWVQNFDVVRRFGD
jgi:heme-degrading monooxygenase HmoA